jgi:CAAX protease family protein
MNKDGGIEPKIEPGVEPDLEPSGAESSSQRHADLASLGASLNVSQNASPNAGLIESPDPSTDANPDADLNASPDASQNTSPEHSQTAQPIAPNLSIAPFVSTEDQATGSSAGEPDEMTTPQLPFLLPPSSASPSSPAYPFAAPFAAPTQPVPSADQAQAEPGSGLLFQRWSQPEIFHPSRIPNFGHLAVLTLLLLLGLLASSLLVRSALHFQLFGVFTVQKAITDIHYTLGSEVILYVFTFLGCLLLFPLIWHKGFFEGLQWNGATAYRMRKRLFGAAIVCFVVALLNGVFMPGPENAPIDKIFRAPGAAWLLFAFGVTFAPFFEELFFRGFLLPALCTSFDWMHERATGAPPLPLAAGDHPQWSLTAMVLGSVATSIPFALMHAQQTGNSVGPLILLVGVSLVLCWTRLATRSLAASVLVHASYNFLLFSLMMLGTEGFRHLEHL